MKPLAEQTFYEILEVPNDAPVEEIERAFDRAMKFYGPDSLATYTLADGGESGRMLELIEEAYLTLSDPKLRRAYDDERSLGPSASECQRADRTVEAHDEAAAGPGPKADGQPSLDSGPQVEASSPPAPRTRSAPADRSPDRLAAAPDQLPTREASPATTGQLAFGPILAAARHYPWPGSCPEAEEESVACRLEALPAERPASLEPAAALSQAVAAVGPLAVPEERATEAVEPDRAGEREVVAAAAAADEVAVGAPAPTPDGQAEQSSEPTEDLSRNPSSTPSGSAHPARSSRCTSGGSGVEGPLDSSLAGSADSRGEGGAGRAQGGFPTPLEHRDATPSASAPQGGEPVEPISDGEPAAPARLMETPLEVSGEEKPLPELFEPPTATAVAASVEAPVRTPRSAVQPAPAVGRAAENPATELPAAERAEASEPSSAVGSTGVRESPAAPKAEERSEEPKPPAQPLPRMPDIAPNAVFNGELLRRVREGRGMTIRDLADRTKISATHLENIEADRYEALPVPVYLRGFLMLVARELKLDPLKVSKSFLELVAKVGSKG